MKAGRCIDTRAPTRTPSRQSSAADIPICAVFDAVAAFGVCSHTVLGGSNAVTRPSTSHVIFTGITETYAAAKGNFTGTEPMECIAWQYCERGPSSGVGTSAPHHRGSQCDIPVGGPQDASSSCPTSQPVPEPTYWSLFKVETL